MSFKIKRHIYTSVISWWPYPWDFLHPHNLSPFPRNLRPTNPQHTKPKRLILTHHSTPSLTPFEFYSSYSSFSTWRLSYSPTQSILKPPNISVTLNMTATSRHLSPTHPTSLTAIYNHLLSQRYFLASTVHPPRVRSSHLQPPPPLTWPIHRHLSHPLLLLTSPQTRPPHQTARKQLQTDKEKKERGPLLEPHRRKETRKNLPN